MPIFPALLGYTYVHTTWMVARIEDAPLSEVFGRVSSSVVDSGQMHLMSNQITTTSLSRELCCCATLASLAARGILSFGPWVALHPAGRMDRVYVHA